MPALALAAIPVIASATAALIAARSARSVKRSEAEAQRIRDLENRISERKYEIYQPIIQALGDVFDLEKAEEMKKGGTNDLTDMLRKFATWITIYGSDEAVRAYHNFMQGAFNEAPTLVTMRLYADLMLAARRDIGADTTVTPAQLFGMRLTDLYIEGDIHKAMTLPFLELCKRESWSPPWIERSGVKKVSTSAIQQSQSPEATE